MQSKRDYMINIVDETVGIRFSFKRTSIKVLKQGLTVLNVGIDDSYHNWTEEKEIHKADTKILE